MTTETAPPPPQVIRAASARLLRQATTGMWFVELTHHSIVAGEPTKLGPYFHLEVAQRVLRELVKGDGLASAKG